MMRHTLLLCFFFLISLVGFSRNHTFILIDVSGNPKGADSNKIISLKERKEAVNIVEDFLKHNLKIANYKNWEVKNPSGILENALNNQNNSTYLGGNDHLVVIPYGERKTYKQYKNFEGNPPDQKVKQAISFTNRLQYDDQLTFGKLARAKAANIALNNKMDKYYFIEISGLGGDNTGSKGMNTNERRLVETYESTVDPSPLGLITLNGSPLSIKFQKVSLHNVSSGKKQKIDSLSHNFRLLAPTGSKSNPQKVKPGEKLMVSWTATEVPEGNEFTIVAYNTESGESYEKSCDDCNRLRMDLNPGKYRVSLSGSELPLSKNNPGYVKVLSSGGPGGLLLVLIIIGLIVAILIYLKRNDPFGWWRKNKKKRDEEEAETSENESEDFELNI